MILSLLIFCYLGEALGIKCYIADLKGLSDENIKVKSYEVEGYITKAGISTHYQYKVTKEHRLCKPLGEDQCYETIITEMDIEDEREMETAYDKKGCLVGKECLRDECYEERENICTTDLRYKWVTPRKRQHLPFYRHLTRWACQVTWECEYREFDANVQILSIEPITYRLETPQGGFVLCEREGHSVKDSLGYHINCPKIKTITNKVKFHCIQHPERILCRDYRDHALLDFTANKTNVIYDTIYHIDNDTQVLMKEKVNELSSGTITDMKRVMREIEMDNLQTILDLSILKNKMYSLSNLVLELILKSVKDDPEMLGRMIGDGFTTESIIGKKAKQCEGENKRGCKCWLRKGSSLACTNNMMCKEKAVNGTALRVMDMFSNYNVETSLVNDLKFKEKVSDVWIDDLRIESRRKVVGPSEDHVMEEPYAWSWIANVKSWIVSHLLILISLILSSYSLHLHLRKR